MKSKHIIKNHVRFKGNFKKEVKGEIPGRDLAEFIAGQLRQKNYVVNSIENEEIWFTVNAASGSIEYPLRVSINYENEDYWEISCPRTLGFFARLRGKSEDTELQNLVNVLDEILQNEETFIDVKWYCDYLDLRDGYIQKTSDKRLSTVGKYLYKSFLPLCAIGMILIIVGAVRHDDKKNLLLVLGTILFLLPFVSYFGFLAISLLWALIQDIKETRRKGAKKKWLRWFFLSVIIAALVVPFFLGLLRIPSVDRVMPTIGNYVGRFCVLLLFCGMLFGVFCGVLSVKKQKGRKRKVLLVVGLIFLLFGLTGFFSPFFSALDMLKWIPGNIELPLAGIDGIDVNREGNLFVACKYYSRIQVYNPKGNFIRGWSLDDTHSKDLKIRVNDENELEVAVHDSRKIDVFDENGKLLETKKYDDRDFFDSFEQKGKHLFDKSTRHHYDVEGWVFPRIIQTSRDGKKKIGKNAFYLFPFQGPFQGWVMAVVGGFLIVRAEKKAKKKQS